MRRGHAARVAAVTTAAIAAVYVVCVTVLNLVVCAHLTAQTDDRLSDRLDDLQGHPAELLQQLSRLSACAVRRAHTTRFSTITQTT